MKENVSPEHEAVVPLNVRSLAQLFDSLDPSPFHEKSLDPAAHRYLVACAREVDGAIPLRLRLHLPQVMHTQTTAIVEAIHNHFRLESEQATRESHARMRGGRRALWRGLLVLVLCSVGRSLIPIEYGFDWLKEGLLILGWVALWRPVEILLYERWEAQDERRAFEQLARANVEFTFVSENDIT